MIYAIKEIHDRAAWTAFYNRAAPDSFLHTWEWGECQTDPVIRLGAYDNKNQLRGAVLFIDVQARRGRYILCPHGPLLAEINHDVLCSLIDASITLGRERQADFIRFAPLLPDQPGQRTQFTLREFRPAPIHVHPELGWILDITPAEDTLLAAMRKTTRYSIRKAEKDGVTIHHSAAAADLHHFWKLYQATVTRQQFIPFSFAYLQREIETFTAHDMVQIFLAEYQGQYVSGAVCIFTPHSGFYHHGASLQVHPKLTASYLLQWRVIQYAKQRGCTKYNFWGINPDDQPHHPWAGLSLFKKGFGGSAHAYVPAQDKPLTKRYWLNWAIEKYRAHRRGYA